MRQFFFSGAGINEYDRSGSNEPGIQFGRSTFTTITVLLKGMILGERIAKPADIAGFLLRKQTGGYIE